MSCGSYEQLPHDLLAHASLDDDGRGVTFFDELPAEIVELIHTSAHRIEVRVAFVPDHMRMRDIETGEII